MSEAEAHARAELEKRAAADTFSGAVIVAKNGTPIFAEAYGFADRDKQIKNTLDTRFRIGSMNKMFTAVAMGPAMKYAYGFMESLQDGRRCFGHGGGAPGMNGQLTICDDGYTIVVLANLDPPAAGRVEHFVLERLPTK